MDISNEMLNTVGQLELNMDISNEMLNTVYQMNDSDVNVSHPEAWYLDNGTPSPLRPLGVLVAAWQLLTALLLMFTTILSSSLRSPRAVLITIHLILLLLISGTFVKLPLVYLHRIVNPFTWTPDAVFCRFHAVAIQFVISALPLVVIAVVADTIVWVRHPSFYESKMASLPGRVVAVLMPWVVAGVVTLGVVLYTMPGGGHLVSGRCIPAFNASRIVSFIVLVLLGRFFLPLVGITVSMILLITATRRHLRHHATAALPPPSEEYSRQRVLHACVSVSVMCGLYICMVGPHYIQVLFLRIPGVARGVNYHKLAHVGYIAVFVHEAFWNLLPILWVTLQLDVLLIIYRGCSSNCSSSRAAQTSQLEPIEGTELEALTTLNHYTQPTKGPRV